MDEVKILARGNTSLPPVLSAVLLSRLKGLFVSVLAAFGEASRQLWRAQFVRSSWDPSSAEPSRYQPWSCPAMTIDELDGISKRLAQGIRPTKQQIEELVALARLQLVEPQRQPLGYSRKNRKE
jgi:hypothetical protein